MAKRSFPNQTNEVRRPKATNGKLPAVIDEKMARTLMDDSPAAMHRADAAGNLVAVNKRWCELTGRSAAAAKGNGWKKMIHPEDRATLVEAWERYVSEANRGLRKDGFRFEYRLLHKDGTWVRMCARCAEERAADGVLLGFCGVSVEVSDGPVPSPSMQPILSAEDEEWMKSILTFAPVGMYRVDLRGECVWVCEKWLKMTGWAREDVVGDGWRRMVHPEDLMRTMKEWEESRAMSSPFVSEYRYVKPDGTFIPVYSRVAEQRDARGVLTGYVGVVVDISELRQEKSGNKQNGQRQAKIADLSKRENDVVRLLRAGLPNKQLALCLGLSVRTVESHRLRIMRKLGFRSLAELLSYATRHDNWAK